MRIKNWYVFFCAMFLVLLSYAQPCYDLSKGEPRVLLGKIEKAKAGDAPNFGEDKKIDKEIVYYRIKLAESICVFGDDFSDPSRFFSTVQLILSFPVDQEMLGQGVQIQIENPYSAHTGYHHEPLVATGLTLLKLTRDRVGSSIKSR